MMWHPFSSTIVTARDKPIISACSRIVAFITIVRRLAVKVVSYWVVGGACVE